jgi:hypothetical protein
MFCAFLNVGGVHFPKGCFRFRMYEQHMDEYLDEEVEVAKIAFDQVCKDWEQKVRLMP